MVTWGDIGKKETKSTSDVVESLFTNPPRLNPRQEGRLSMPLSLHHIVGVTVTLFFTSHHHHHHLQPLVAFIQYYY